MLGHLKPRFCRLSTASKQHYKHLYCSICYSLRQQFGLPASFLINHEMTLSLAAFSDYASMQTETCACPAKLFCGQKPILCDALIDKAAQLCLVLVWLKLIDSETDKPAFYKKRLRRTIEQKIQPIINSLNPATQQFIDNYLLLIRSNSTDFLTTTKMSGLLAKQFFQELCQKPISNQHSISEITLLLGELITIADALLDLKQDIAQQQFNPIINASKQHQTCIDYEYQQLKTNYQHLNNKIISLINQSNLKITNSLFSEILLQSLQNLSGNIQQATHLLFANNTNNQRNSTRKKRWSDCFDGCCDCCECCGESRCYSSCGESCNCCECGCCGCDC